MKDSHLQLSYALFSMGLSLPSSFCADCYFVLYLFERLTPKWSFRSGLSALSREFGADKLKVAKKFEQAEYVCKYY